METRAPRIGGWVGRFPAARVMSVLVLAGALLGSMARPAAAQSQDPNTPLRMDFVRLDCQREMDDGGSDEHSEPYLVVFAADLQGPVVRARTVCSIFSDVDSGETHYSDPVTRVWDFNGPGAPIADPDQVIFLCALLEADDDSIHVDDVSKKVQQDLSAKLMTYRAQGLRRDDIVAYLKRDMTTAINLSRHGDDWIGFPQELRLTMDDLKRARAGTQPQVIKTLWHQLGGASYSTTYVLQTTSIIIF
jgi:hypothetical protein